MPQIISFELRRKFGEVLRKAQQEPVEIIRHGRREFILMPADHYDWLQAAATRSHLTREALSFVTDAVERAEMDPPHR